MAKATTKIHFYLKFQLLFGAGFLICAVIIGKVLQTSVYFAATHNIFRRLRSPKNVINKYVFCRSAAKYITATHNIFRRLRPPKNVTNKHVFCRAAAKYVHIKRSV